jgi:hypothetical protein
MSAVSHWSDKSARRRPVDRRFGAKRPPPGVILAVWAGAVIVPWAVLVALINFFL